MTPAGGQREKLHGKFANRLREKIRGDGEDFPGKAARRKARGREEGGENLCPCDQTTQKLERHKLIKMHSASPRQPLTFSPLCFIPSFSLSHFTSLHHLAASFSRRRAGSDGGGGCLMFLGGCVHCCQRSRPPHFLYGGVSDVNEAGWPLVGRLGSCLPPRRAVWAEQWWFCRESSFPALLRRDQPLLFSQHTAGNLSQQLVRFHASL